MPTETFNITPTHLVVADTKHRTRVVIDLENLFTPDGWTIFFEKRESGQETQRLMSVHANAVTVTSPPPV